MERLRRRIIAGQRKPRAKCVDGPQFAGYGAPKEMIKKRAIMASLGSLEQDESEKEYMPERGRLGLGVHDECSDEAASVLQEAGSPKRTVSS